jgi:hypothetical protein
MERVVPPEPQSAADYADRTTTAVKAVLVEIGQILGSFRGKFAVVGGVVPWLLLDNDSMRHVGTLDVDLSLNAEALGGGEYAKLIEALMGNGYQQRQDLRRFQLLREVPATDGGDPIDIVIDFLMPRGAIVEKNIPALIGEFAVQRASGAELAMNFYKLVAVEGPMPEGGTNRVEIAVASIPALLAMKGFAIRDRHKQKDAYDIYYCVRNYPGGISALATDCAPLLALREGSEGYRAVADKFNDIEGYGPTSVRRFVEDTQLLGERSPDQWQQDAFGQVDAWLRALGLRD